MTDIEVNQAVADAFIAMEKYRIDNKEMPFPAPGDRLTVPLTSADKRKQFLLDVTRFQIKMTKATFQQRARQAVVLLRLDIDGPLHRNPDGQEILCPHLHIYREGYGVKWAISAPRDKYPDTSNLFATFEAFMQQCNIILPPSFKVGLF